MDSGGKKTFPIKNEAACVFKWGWNTFRLYNGKSSSCHRIDPVFVPLDDFENFHNTPEVLNDRRLMFQGQWPTGRGCEYCKDVEAAGGISDRLFHNEMEELTPVDFGNGNLHVTPRIQEIYLNNTCDLACMYCAPNFSSKINQELKKLGPLPTMMHIQPLNRSPDQQKYLAKMLEWLDKNYHNLRRFLMQGGEPFLQKEFFQVVDHMETLSNPDLEFSVNSNLNADTKIFEEFVPRVRKLLLDRRIKRFDITCSIDCWGPAQEFIRFGLNLEQWKKNFEFLSQHRWIYISTGHTITSMSLHSMPALLKMLNDYEQNQGLKYNQTFGYVDGPTQILYDPINFGGKFFKDVMDEILELAPRRTDQQKRNHERLTGIVQYIKNSQPDRERLKRLYQTLDHYDVRRGTDWKSVLPEIYQYFLENEITYVV